MEWIGERPMVAILYAKLLTLFDTLMLFQGRVHLEPAAVRPGLTVRTDAQREIWCSEWVCRCVEILEK
jgi:hypothetical protein